MKIIETVKVNDKNTREVNTADGTKLVLSLKLYPFDIYLGGIWLPKNVQMGDVVDIYVDSIKAEEKDGKTYYNAQYAKASKNFLLSEESGSNNAPIDLFGGNEAVDIPDDKLPF